jgi:hypothetical protein
MNKIIFLLLFFTQLVYCQITSATLNGKVLFDNTTIKDIEITVLFTPTNSVYLTTTDKSGRFSLDNLDVGGPYIIIIIYKNKRYIKSNITLLLGDNDIDKITIYDE